MPLLDGSAGVGTNSAAYLLLRNDGERRDGLVGGESPAASAVEVHESVMYGEVMRMQKVEELELPAHGTVEMKPGGVHLMLLGITRPLEDGEEIEITLRFMRSGEMTVTLPVRLVGGE